MDWNKYTYVRDNPVNYTDPSGKSICYDPLPSACQSALQALHAEAANIKGAVQGGGLEPVEGFAQFADFSETVFHAPAFKSDVRDLVWAMTLVINDFDANRGPIFLQVSNEAKSPYYIDQDWLPYQNNPLYNNYHWCDSQGHCGGGGQDYGVWRHSRRGDWKTDYWDKTANQAYHFWFYAAVTFFDGRGWAVLGNLWHDHGPWDNNYLTQPENVAPPVSGRSQQDYFLSFQGMDLGTKLAEDERARKFWEGIYGNCDVTQLPFIHYQWTDPGNWIRTHLKQ